MQYALRRVDDLSPSTLLEAWGQLQSPEVCASSDTETGRLRGAAGPLVTALTVAAERGLAERVRHVLDGVAYAAARAQQGASPGFPGRGDGLLFLLAANWPSHGDADLRDLVRWMLECGYDVQPDGPGACVMGPVAAGGLYLTATCLAFEARVNLDRTDARGSSAVLDAARLTLLENAATAKTVHWLVGVAGASTANAELSLRRLGQASLARRLATWRSDRERWLRRRAMILWRHRA